MYEKKQYLYGYIASGSEGTYQPPLSGAPTDLIGHAWSLLQSPFGESIVTLNLGSSGEAVRAYICGASLKSLGASTYHIQDEKF